MIRVYSNGPVIIDLKPFKMPDGNFSLIGNDLEMFFLDFVESRVDRIIPFQSRKNEYDSLARMSEENPGRLLVCERTSFFTVFGAVKSIDMEDLVVVVEYCDPSYVRQTTQQVNEEELPCLHENFTSCLGIRDVGQLGALRLSIDFDSNDFVLIDNGNGTKYKFPAKNFFK